MRALNKHRSVEPEGIHPAELQPKADKLQETSLELFKAYLRLGEILADGEITAVVAMHKVGFRHMVGVSVVGTLRLNNQLPALHASCEK